MYFWKSGAAQVVSYPDPNFTAADGLHHCYGLHHRFSRSGDVIHPQLWKFGSGHETTAQEGPILSPDEQSFEMEDRTKSEVVQRQWIVWNNTSCILINTCM